MGVLDRAVLGRPLGAGLASVPGCTGVTNVGDPAAPGEMATAVFALENHSSSTEVAVTAAVFVNGFETDGQRSYTLYPGELRGGNAIDFIVPAEGGSAEVEVRVTEANEVPEGF